MKVNEPGRIAAIQKYAGNSGKRIGGAESVRRKDELSISQKAKELLESNRVSHGDHSEKVKELKKTVSSGTYHIDAGKIADKLMPYFTAADHNGGAN